MLGLVFLEYIADAFEEQYERLVAERARGADPEDSDEYRAPSIFWVPPIDLIGNIKVGDEASRSKDVLGRVYEYFFSQFASAEGRKGGGFYPPRCVVKLLVELLEPHRDRVYDPCCGSPGTFVQSAEFIRAYTNGNGNGGDAQVDISIYDQESNYTTCRLAKRNLAIRDMAISGDTHAP